MALYKKLEKIGKTAIEVCSLAFIMGKVMIAESDARRSYLIRVKLALIADFQSDGPMKKTDKEDALKLARIIEQFRDDQLPSVPVPPPGSYP
jgi:hypothetical protein